MNMDDDDIGSFMESLFSWQKCIRVLKVFTYSTIWKLGYIGGIGGSFRVPDKDVYRRTLSSFGSVHNYFKNRYENYIPLIINYFFSSLNKHTLFSYWK